jgi:hypothetical protein
LDNSLIGRWISISWYRQTKTLDFFAFDVGVVTDVKEGKVFVDSKMRVFMLFHLRLVDGIVPQTTYQEDSTEGVCLLKNTPKQKQEINLWVY